MLGYNFINSQEVASYLEKLDYRFSTAEMAWLIKQNAKLTMEERHQAWRKMMEDMTDEPISAGGICNSVFELLSLYMGEEKRAVAQFYEADGDCRYRYRFEYADDELFEACSVKEFDTYEACAESYMKATDRDTIIVYIEKSDGSGNAWQMVASPFLEVVRISKCTASADACRLGALDSIFAGMRPSVPLPFSVGDTVNTVVGMYGSFEGAYFDMILAGSDPDNDCEGELYGYVLTERGDRLRVLIPNPLNLEFASSRKC
jgi:hypothetical protein